MGVCPVAWPLLQNGLSFVQGNFHYHDVPYTSFLLASWNCWEWSIMQKNARALKPNKYELKAEV